MKIIVLGLALFVAFAVAEVLPSVEYLPPVQEIETIDNGLSGLSGFSGISGISGLLADDGYRYKTVKRVRVHRQRRDVSELPSSEYLPPVQQQVSYAAPAPIQQVSYAAPAPIQQVSSISVPSNEYLAPIAPAAEVAQISSGVLADDGYRYKTVKRYRLRHRRDVNELPSSEYLPPVQQQVSYAAPAPIQQVSYAAPAPIQQVSSISVPSNEYLAPIAPAAEVAQISSGVLADDGYRYKTVKRYRLRHRRDVNELPSSEYLPPVQQQVSYAAPAPVQQVSYAAPAPIQQVSSISVPSNEYLAPIAPAAEVAQISSGVLADDGYRYKTVKRYRLRHRRDVNELPSSEYLPPVQQQVSYAAPAPVQQVSYAAPAPIQQVSSISVPSNEYLAPIAPAAEVAQISSGVLADDGYRYKTVKRYRLRHRRDVNELPSSEYLPPVQQQVSYAAPAPIQQVSYAAPAPIQQVSSISVPSNEYLAPIAPAAEVAQISSGVLADDGYRYKTVKRYRLRHRRDVSELPSVQYLPPVQQQVSLPQIAIQQPIQQIPVTIPSSQYLSPIEIPQLTSNVLSGVLADDGYRYKTVKKTKRRH